jgi:hypothetical protein
MVDKPITSSDYIWLGASGKSKDEQVLFSKIKKKRPSLLTPISNLMHRGTFHQYIGFA